MKGRNTAGTYYAPGSKRFRVAAAVLAAVTVTSSLTACGSASTAFSKEAVMETATASMDTASVNTAAMEMAAPKTTGGGKPSGIAPESFAGNAESGGTANILTSANTIQPVATSRKLIRNVNLNVETTEFDTLLASISNSVTSLGGYLETSDISGTSISTAYEQQRYASLTARIPSNQLDGFIAQVDAQGNVTNKSESTQDVTLQYSDVESRKKSLTIEQERLWALLEKADSVDAVIALESRLSEIRYQLESFESQLRAYDNQVDYSTVYLSIHEVKVFTPTSPDSVLTRMQKGFQKSLDDVGNGLLNFSVWFVSSLPVLIVLAMIITVLLMIVKLVIFHNDRKVQRKNGKKTEPTADAAQAPLCTGPPVGEMKAKESIVADTEYKSDSHSGTDTHSAQEP